MIDHMDICVDHMYICVYHMDICVYHIFGTLFAAITKILRLRYALSHQLVICHGDFRKSCILINFEIMPTLRRWSLDYLKYVLHYRK